MKLLVIDTETGGLNPEQHSLLSVGLVVWSDGQILDQLELLVQDAQPSVDPEAIAATGFDLSLLSCEGRAPREVVARIEQFLCKNFGPELRRPRISVAGHNVHFDVAFLARVYRQADVKFTGLFSHRFMDTASVLAFLVLAGRLPPTCASSTGAFEHFGIRFEPGKRHTALADALATADLLNGLIRSLDRSSDRP
jgi:DNA polymerase-3 subunit epsilon